MPVSMAAFIFASNRKREPIWAAASANTCIEHHSGGGNVTVKFNQYARPVSPW